MANTRHSCEEVTAAIEKLKAKQPRALLTVEDLQSVVNTAVQESEDDIEDDSDDESDGEVMWNQEDQDSAESDIAYMAASDAKSIEITLSENSFLLGYQWSTDETMVYTVTRSTNTHDRPRFKGITMDTAANRRSVMSEEQYSAYQEEFGRRVPMRAPKRDVQGIGGKSLAVDEVTLQIPFTGLGIVLDIELSILREGTLSILCNKDLLDNNLDISLQGGYLYIGDRKKHFMLDNCFFIHLWSVDDVPFVLYTEGELRRIHRSFGHPSVASTHRLLKRASTKPLKRGLRRKLEELAQA